jgi:hypothetical protein
LNAAVDPDVARREAERILRDRRFRHDPAPRPLRGPLQWLGDRLSTVLDWIGHVLSPIPWWMWLGIALAIVAAVAARIVVASQRRRGAAGAPAGRWRRARGEEPEDPDALEAEADAAERAGDLACAIRLRFRAGLLRLGDRGAIQYRPSMTTREVRAALGSHAFDELARTFEAVAYGGRTPGTDDVKTARREWPRVLDEAGRP